MADLPEGAPKRRILPTGTITFLFTDIEGSTPLLERLGERYDEILDEHRRIMREAFTAYEGHELAPQGDGCCVAFARATDALRAALEAQLGLAGHPWPEDAEPKVRMGLHTGEARVAPDGYCGLALHQAHRICATAHGGQVVLSRTTRDLVGSEVPEDVSLRSLGDHRVRDFPEPQPLYQLVHPRLTADFPPPRSTSRPGSRLPVPRTSFVGREHELRAVRKLLGATRLLTLTGPGGSGKTRLCLEAAAEPDELSTRHVWFVELGGVEDAAGISRAIATVVDVPEDPDRPLLEAIAGSIGAAESLLILDNCEHVADACARAVDELLSACSGLRVLATSREVLGVAGETRLVVPPLSVPAPELPDMLEALYDYDAVRLFCDRASLGQPDFSLTPENAAAVVAICRRLDGIPLAIELAAARVPLLSPPDLAARLDDRFAVLSSSLRDVPARQRTLRSAIDWSFDLLSDRERLLLSRLASLAGTFPLDAVEGICTGGDISRADVLDILEALVSRSLVQVELREEAARYRLLESIHAYAAERLSSSGEEDSLRARHLHWFLELAEEAERELRGLEQGRWLDRLEVEHDNVRAALQWSLAAQKREEALRLAAALSVFWEVRGHLSEGRAWLEAALAGYPPSPLRARSLLRAATLARIEGDFAATRSLSEEALALLRSGGDERGIASSLTLLGSVSEGEHAASLSSDSLSLARQLREVSGLTSSMRELGSLAWEEGDLASVEALHEESLSIARRIGDKASEADSLAWLGNVASTAGAFGDARARYEQALALFEEIGDRRRQADVLSNLGLCAQAEGDAARAKDLHEKSLSIRREIGHRRGIAISSLNLAELAQASGDEREAQVLLAESLSVAAELGDERIEAAARIRMTARKDAGSEAAEQGAPSSVETTAVFRREGEFWTIEFGGGTARLRDSKGLRHLAVLLTSPGRELHVLDLVRALEGGAAPARSLGPLTEDHIDRLVVESDPFGDAGEVLDEQAKAAYKARLDDLRDELEEAESFGDTERASRARAEIDALTEQLAAAVGIGGRDRKVSSASERARWSVSRAIRSALTRIMEAYPALGEHLEATVKTGTYCSYSPDPRAPIQWSTS